MSETLQTNNKLPLITSLVLVIFLGIFSAKLMWLLLSPKQNSTEQIKVTNQGTTIKTKEIINYGKLIANQHLFGTVAIKKTPVANPLKQSNTSKVTATKLHLKLHGIVSYKSSNDGYALISSSKGKQKAYAVGDSLQDGVTISHIFSNKVVLDNHGKSEELLLPIKKSPSNKKQQAASQLSDLPGININNVNKPLFNDGSSNINLSKVRQEALSSPQKLLEIASPSPAIVNGEFLGFRVRPGRKRKLFRQLGFKPNDIITEVNGIILDDASKGALILGELSQASDLSITVKRGSQVIALPSLQF